MLIAMNNDRPFDDDIGPTLLNTHLRVGVLRTGGTAYFNCVLVWTRNVGVQSRGREIGPGSIFVTVFVPASA